MNYAILIESLYVSRHTYSVVQPESNTTRTQITTVPSNMSNDEKRKADSSEQDDDEPDEWDQRINKTGCADENLKLQLCHADTGDWRQCLKEMKEFKECWDRNQNNLRTSTIDNDDRL